MPNSTTQPKKATSKSSRAFVNTAIAKRNIRKYFRQMRVRLVVGLMAMYLVYSRFAIWVSLPVAL